MLPCVATRTDPLSHLLLEWEAFAQLSTDRPVGLTRGAVRVRGQADGVDAATAALNKLSASIQAANDNLMRTALR